MPTFTLASFNICSAHFREGHYTEDNLNRLAEQIAQSSADVVCLQEVDRGAARSDRVDMPAYLSEHTELKHHYFIKIRDFQGGEYGTAILSRYPITDAKTLNYPVTVATQGTSCGYAVLDVEGMPVTVFNTHLSVENEESNTETLCCLGDILATLRREEKSFLCCGDFNTSPKKVARFIPWVNLAHNGLTTYADRSIDHILYFGSIAVANTRTMNTQKDKVTDHNMVLTEVTV
jgi:endonuclease/exonuclease/phosphatase family metal-dependent hydrolase